MKKIFKFIRKETEQVSDRITSETVDHHREQILAGGRRFKYPVQYVKHKLVINAVAIISTVVLLLSLLGWWQLYVVQNTSEFMYRFTRVLPLPVAKIDGQFVSYSDYLMKYISSIYYLEQKEQVNLKTEDGKRQVEYVKNQSMNDAIADAYAFKLSKNLKISINDVDIESFIKTQRQTSEGEISEQTYETVISDYYGWSLNEYKSLIKSKLLRQKVAYEIDKDATDASNKISDILKSNSNYDFKTLVNDNNGKLASEISYGASGWVPKTNQDGGLAIEASKLSKGQIASVFKPSTGDGYYFIKLIDINDSQISYEYIKVSLSTFSKSLDEAEKSKLEEYIKIN